MNQPEINSGNEVRVIRHIAELESQVANTKAVVEAAQKWAHNGEADMEIILGQGLIDAVEIYEKEYQ